MYLERQTTRYAAEFNALQSGSSTSKRTLDCLGGLLRQAGLSGQEGANDARRFLSRMIEGQASVMGFCESFLLVAALFFIALLPAWCMRPKRSRL